MPAQLTPSIWLFLTEGVRALGDAVRFLIWRGTLIKNLPPGRGQTVLVLPGFLAGDSSTYLLRTFLNSLGYRAEGWKLGINRGLKEGMQDRLQARLSDLAARDGKMTIVGQSLGGVFARELAKRQPETVQQVITLGSPIAIDPQSKHARAICHLATGQRFDDVTPALEQIRDPAPVPCTALFSRRDGIVHWHAARETIGPSRENVEVGCSHIGMALDPGVLVTIADRLAQQPDHWAPFSAPNCAQKLYPVSR